MSGVCWNHLERGTGKPWMGSSRASTENISWVIRAPHGQCQVQEKMPSGARGTFPVPPPVVGLGTKLGKHCCSHPTVKRRWAALCVRLTPGIINASKTGTRVCWCPISGRSPFEKGFRPKEAMLCPIHSLLIHAVPLLSGCIECLFGPSVPLRAGAP